MTWRPGRISAAGFIATAEEFVCGNATTIAPDVRTSLTTIFRKRTGARGKDAEAWLTGLRAEAGLVEDIWGG